MIMRKISSILFEIILIWMMVISLPTLESSLFASSRQSLSRRSCSLRLRNSGPTWNKRIPTETLRVKCEMTGALIADYLCHTHTHKALTWAEEHITSSYTGFYNMIIFSNIMRIGSCLESKYSLTSHWIYLCEVFTSLAISSVSCATWSARLKPPVTTEERARSISCR